MRSFAILCALVAMLAVVSGQSTGSPAQPATICDRLTVLQGLDFTSPADEYTAMRNLVWRLANGTATFTGLFQDPVTRNYFNGAYNFRNAGPVAQPFAGYTPGVTPDFTVAGSTAQNSLIDHITLFLGASGALNCAAWGTSSTYQYSSTATGFGTFNQYQVHANMNITGTIFSTFNSKVITTANSYQVSSADQTAIQGVLGSFGRNNAAGGQSNEICWESNCPCATGVTGENCDNAGSAAGVQASVASLLIAAFVAVFAMRR